MSRKIAEEVLPRLRQGRVGISREGRSQLSDEVCEQRDESRKQTIKLLASQASESGKVCSCKRRPLLHGEAEAAVLWRIYKGPRNHAASGSRPCSRTHGTKANGIG